MSGYEGKVTRLEELMDEKEVESLMQISGRTREELQKAFDTLNSEAAEHIVIKDMINAISHETLKAVRNQAEFLTIVLPFPADYIIAQMLNTISMSFTKTLLLQLAAVNDEQVFNATKGLILKQIENMTYEDMQEIIAHVEKTETGE